MFEAALLPSDFRAAVCLSLQSHASEVKFISPQPLASSLEHRFEHPCHSISVKERNREQRFLKRKYILQHNILQYVCYTVSSISVVWFGGVECHWLSSAALRLPPESLNLSKSAALRHWLLWMLREEWDWRRGRKSSWTKRIVSEDILNICSLSVAGQSEER